ncbi:MAG: branched-chain amino acid ABC transporter permease [Candidatus Thioglobus sp.]|nr:branched-chain amino acid ABC transporter permease [Candidatus Thioglobus sp.]
MMKENKQNTLIWLGLAISAIVPLLLPNHITVLTYIWVMIILALTWDMLGGQTGYTSFGNILFFGVGMYVCAVVQRDMFSSGLERFERVSEIVVNLSVSEYFISLAIGTISGAIVAVILAIILGSGILGMRGHYFAICTLGLGHAAAEITSGIEYLGAGSGMVAPLYPSEFLMGKEVFYYYSFLLVAVATFFLFKKIYKSQFGLALNAIRDNENKAESMGIHTTQYKIAGWSISAFFLAIAGAGVGNVIGFIDPVEIAFSGPTFGVWMIVMAILGGKGTIWGPVLGAIILYSAKETFWTYLLGWDKVALGLLILIVVVYFPKGILGYFKDKKQLSDNVLSPKGEG